MTDTAIKPKRPTSIILISVFGILMGLLSFWFLIQPNNQKLGIWYTVFIVLGGIVFLVCGLGFWFMKKWAFYSYLVFAVLDQIVLLLMGRWTLMALLISIIVVFFGYRNLSKMS